MEEPAFPPIQAVRVRAASATHEGASRKTNDDAHAFVEDRTTALAVVAHGVAHARSGGRRAADLTVETCLEMFRGRTTTVLDDLAEIWWRGEHGEGKGKERPRPYTALPIADRASLRDRVRVLLASRAPESMGDIAVLEAETRSVLAIPERAFERTSASLCRRADEHRASWEGIFASAAGIIFADGRASIAHVGTCGVVRLRRTILDRLTEPHTMRGEMRRARPDASPEELEGVPDGVVLRGLGLARLAIDTQTIPLEQGDRYLLLSPGLADAFSDRELATSLRTHGARAASDLVARAQDLQPGNLTAIVVEIL